MNTPYQDFYASFWEHIEELRRTFLKVGLILLIGTFVSFLGYAKVIDFLTIPLTSLSSDQHSLVESPIETIRVHNTASTALIYQLPEDASGPFSFSSHVKATTSNTYEIPPKGYITYVKEKPLTSLIILSPLEGILIALKTSLWCGALITSPLWLFCLLQFVAPALKQEEKKLIWPFLLTSLSFILLGFAFAYTLTIPIANSYLMQFNSAVGTNMWSLGNYLDYTLFLLLANGLAFEIAVVGLFAVHLQIISAEGLLAKRRVAIVMAFIIGALLTPPDVITQLMLAVPLIMLYEVLILFAKFKTQKNE